ncbi:MAG: hypothetical protein PHD76_12755 [Methylacidiphilales bacterium]|nr:hypothetical protein [Candidatus Methylacidiphilales bacterium]
MAEAGRSAENMSDNSTLLINCVSHGKRIAAVVCCHMLSTKDHKVGFIENSSDPNDLQAWCSECEAMFLSEGDKTEAFRQFNDLAIVCTDCYASIKKLHSD